jgi:hypothetical protein
LAQKYNSQRNVLIDFSHSFPVKIDTKRVFLHRFLKNIFRDAVLFQQPVMIFQRCEQIELTVGQMVFNGVLIQLFCDFRIVYMMDIWKKMMHHMIIKATHKETGEEVVFFNIIGGKHHMHHPAVR